MNIFSWIKKLILSVFSPKDFSDIVHAENRQILKKAFIFSIGFGALVLLYTLIFAKENVEGIQIFYYSYYVVMGLIGLCLCYLKSGKYTPVIFGLLEFAIIFLLYIQRKNFTEAIIFFLGFVLALEMLLNLNPIDFSIGMVLYELLVVLFQCTGVIHLEKPEDSVLFWNLSLVNVIIIYLSFWKRKITLRNFIIEKNIEAEKQKSEELLLNILPKSIMEELRTNGRVEPVSFDSVSVLFCEIKNFEELSSLLKPQELVNELNELYSSFDEIVEESGCLRIKTFGEIYMASCGLPEVDALHAERCIKCGKAFLEFAGKRNKSSGIKIEVGVGISSGSVIAGIVGIKKYIYDIFGDTVNTAFRMKTLSKAGQLKISPDTFKLVEGKFDFDCQEPVEVKGKGLMETYNLK
ncbi:MAG: adenylate/guanylate cyclase domain-containing protein [Treponema sp.]|nr:adenylate/guanylate cyclase domain-containing protein [Treponema sp.]